MHFIPGLRLRVPEETEIIGIDHCEMGESAYDYVELETELGVVREAPQTLELHPSRSDDSP